jgi:hypothetical protein
MSDKLLPLIAGLQNLALSIEGVKSAPEILVPSITELPFVIAYPARGELDMLAKQSKNLHTVFWEIHVAKILLPEAITESTEIFALLDEAVKADPTIGGLCDTVVFPYPYTFGGLEWAGKKAAHIGYRFEITAKIHKALT